LAVVANRSTKALASAIPGLCAAKETRFSPFLGADPNFSGDSSAPVLVRGRARTRGSWTTRHQARGRPTRPAKAAIDRRSRELVAGSEQRAAPAQQLDVSLERPSKPQPLASAVHFSAAEQLQRSGQHRRAFAGLLVIGLVALAVGVAQALAGTGTATAPIEKNNESCGTDIGTSTIGSVTFTRDDKTTLRTAVRLTKFAPSTKYRVFLVSGGCSEDALLGYIKTDSNGQGNATFTSSTFGHQSFFIYVLPEVCCATFGASVLVKVDG
jgi:hypothetical protein